MNACAIECIAIVLHMVVRVTQRPAQAVELQRPKLIEATRFDRLEIARLRCLGGHASPPTRLLRGFVDDVTVDAIALAAKERDDLGVLVSHFDIVDTGTPGAAALYAGRMQHIASMCGCEKFDRASLRDSVAVVAVAGECERAVGEQ